MNMILDRMGGQSSNNPILNMFQMVRNSQNPAAMIQALAQQNPQINEVMNYIGQNGGDAKTAFYNLAQQRGVNPNDIINMLR